MKDGTEPTSLQSIPKEINFIDGLDGNHDNPNGAISIPNFWIYSYVNSEGLFDWVRKGGTGSLNQTEGFIFKGPGKSQNYTFSGTPKDGTLTTFINMNQHYLVGNPYASALNSKKFIRDNIESIDGSLYFWDRDVGNPSNSHAKAGSGGYATRNLSMGVAASGVDWGKLPGLYIPVGQAFFISGYNKGGDIVFKNSQREYKTIGESSLFFKGTKSKTNSNTIESSTEALPILKVGMDYLNDENKMMHRQIGISFKQNNSFNYDSGYDSPIFDLHATDMFWKFPENNEKYVIAGVQEFSEDIEIPIGIVAEADGKVAITLDTIENITADIFLRDKETGIQYMLSNSDTGAQLNLSEGTYLDRFALAFKDEQLGIDWGANFDIGDQDIGIYFGSSDNEIVLVNNKNMNLLKVVVYDTLGNELATWSDLGNVKLQKLKSDITKEIIHIIKVYTDSKEISKKVMLY